MISSPPINPRAFDTDLTGVLAVRTKLTRGDLIPRPFEFGQCVTADSSGATISFPTGIANKDGSALGINVSVASGQNGFRLHQPFSGRAFGIRFRRSNATPSEITVRIDGVAYAVSTILTRAQLYSQTIEDDQCNILVADDLPEGEHLAEITVVAPPSGSSSILFFGYLAEKRAGYIPSPNADVPIVGGSNTPTVASNIYDCTANANGARRISKVRWHNNTGGSAVVTVKYNAIFYAQLTIVDKDSAELPFNPPVVMNSLWTHSSPGGGANLPFFVFGSY